MKYGRGRRMYGGRAGLAASVLALAAMVVSQVASAASPANTAPPEISGSAVVGQTLTASTGSWSDSPTGYAYQWQQCDGAGANCADIAGETTSSYVVAGGDDSHTLAVVVTATNADGSTSASSAPTAAVIGVTPAHTGQPTISGTLLVGRTLSADTGSWSGTTPLTFAYEWDRCVGGSCTSIAGATASSYTTGNDDAGTTLEVVVTASNSGGSDSATSAETGVIGSVTAPVSTVAPVVSGPVAEGATLAVTSGSWTGADSLSFAYQWQRCTSGDQATCSDIGDATDASYTATADDVGDLLQARVTATDSVGPATAVSSQVGPVEASTLPVNVTLPSFSGDPVVGATLTGAIGDWTGTVPIGYTLQWQRCTGPDPSSCTDIAGADGVTYTVTGGDLGLAVQLHVVATNPATGAGPGVGAYSLQATVTEAAPSNLEPPVVSGTVEEGGELSADAGSWTGETPISYNYQWERCSSVYAAAVAADAPLAYWRLDEPNGTSLGDSSGRGQAASFAAGDLTLGQPGALSPEGDAAASFSAGQGARATLSGLSGSYVTVEFWLKWDGVHGGSPAGFSAYGVYLAPGQFGFTSTQGQLSGGYYTSATPAANQWVLVDAVFYNGSLANDRLYVNGVQQSLSQSGWPSGSSVGSMLNLGSYLNGSSGILGFTGGLDEFAVYNRALNQAEIQAHYSAASASSSCTGISGATETAYTPTSADVGLRLRVAVTASNGAGEATSDSTVSDPVLPAGPPESTSPPIISGSGLVGDALSASPGQWSHSPTGYAYQWQRCSSPTSCTDIVGATLATYTAAASDAGDTVRVRVTASNVLGSSSPADSTAIAVSDSAPANVTLPAISGEPSEGETLTTSNGAWSGDQTGLYYTYQWQRCSSGYAATIEADSPLAYWRLDDGGGTTFADVSGQGTPATFAFGDVSLNQPGALVSEGDAAASFNVGKGAQANVSGLSGSYTTVEFWMKWDGVHGVSRWDSTRTGST
ncbi:MAG TPA: LamG-like jellyroll fold domain-containing protein [Gaiellaceae bacterium]|nr:LamG-like jellyroll fold domain-containing protein [Gaiellaceae bacterium]